MVTLIYALVATFLVNQKVLSLSFSHHVDSGELGLGGGECGAVFHTLSSCHFVGDCFFAAANYSGGRIGLFGGKAGE